MISLDTPVVLAFTPNYFIPAVVCIQSILDHAPKNKNSCYLPFNGEAP